jgi:hypothetical protein
MALPHKKTVSWTSTLTRTELKREAKKYIDLPELFPGGIDLRTKLSDYQAKKIRAALREVEKIADGMTAMRKDFVPVKHMKQYASKNKLPKYLKGVFMNGGADINKMAAFDSKSGRLSYVRGFTERDFVPLNCWSERSMMLELNEELKRTDEGMLYLAANGRVMRGTQAPTDDKEYIRVMARLIFTTYKDMSDRGEMRRVGTKHKTLAAHPNKWGIGLIFEKAEKTSAAKAWKTLTAEQKAGWNEGAKHLKTTKRQAFIHVYNS